ncbi:MAG: fatty acid hydroxylase, partial [Chitinophagia bacterium]|nr:fatty acid hydroxylase [Chitinophagia bacterium]
RIIYTMHGVHHEYPRDRLFMPPLPSILLASVLFYGMQLPLGRFAYAFFPGFLLGYLAYGSMHYAIHAFAPPRWLKALWRNHHLHHYKHPDKGFGVSSVLWDIVFGTVPEKD